MQFADIARVCHPSFLALFFSDQKSLSVRLLICYERILSCEAVLVFGVILQTRVNLISLALQGVIFAILHAGATEK